MKNSRSTAQRRQAARALYRAFLALGDERECAGFLEDLCTPAELEAMIDRWSVVPLLEQGLPYREIHDRTGVSVTTIGRVARCLAGATGGYRSVLNTLGTTT